MVSTDQVPSRIRARPPLTVLTSPLVPVSQPYGSVDAGNSALFPDAAARWPTPAHPSQLWRSQGHQDGVNLAKSPLGVIRDQDAPGVARLGASRVPQKKSARFKA
jgi:hypothetical protein